LAAGKKGRYFFYREFGEFLSALFAKRRGEVWLKRMVFEVEVMVVCGGFAVGIYGEKSDLL